MKRFRYALDPVCLIAILCYATNRWFVPLEIKGSFLRGHFADLLLIPAALPPMLWFQRRLGLRVHDAHPGQGEVWFHAVIWALAAEGVAPHLFRQATGDLWDLAAYATGAFAALLFWKQG